MKGYKGTFWVNGHILYLMVMVVIGLYKFVQVHRPLYLKMGEVYCV